MRMLLYEIIRGTCACGSEMEAQLTGAAAHGAEIGRNVYDALASTACILARKLQVDVTDVTCRTSGKFVNGLIDVTCEAQDAAKNMVARAFDTKMQYEDTDPQSDAPSLVNMALIGAVGLSLTIGLVIAARCYMQRTVEAPTRDTSPSPSISYTQADEQVPLLLRHRLTT
jgi:hypothetical protein